MFFLFVFFSQWSTLIEESQEIHRMEHQVDTCTKIHVLYMLAYGGSIKVYFLFSINHQSLVWSDIFPYLFKKRVFAAVFQSSVLWFHVEHSPWGMVESPQILTAGWFGSLGFEMGTEGVFLGTDQVSPISPETHTTLSHWGAYSLKKALMKR